MKKTLIYLILTATFMFVLIELAHPMFFLHDDNFTLAYADFLHSWRAIFTYHEIPFYNLYQRLGKPALSVGSSCVLYLPNYLFMALSKLFTGDFYWCIDIGMYFHIICGIIGMFFLLTNLNLSKKSAFFGAITFIFANATMYFNSAWFVSACVTAYLPWMCYLTLCVIKDGKGSKWLVLARVLSYLMGHAQFFAYACIVEMAFAGYAISEQRKNGIFPKQNFKKYIFSYVFTIIFALPQLLPQFMQMRSSATRNGMLSWGETLGIIDLPRYLLGLIVPYSSDIIQPLSFIGFCPLVLIFIAFAKRGNKFFKINLICWLLFVFGVFPTILHFVPILGSFRWAIKGSIFVAFWAAILAAIVLEQFPKLPFILPQIATSLFVLIFLSNCRFGVMRPADLSFNLGDVIDDGKVVSITSDYQDASHYDNLFTHYATIFEKISVLGFDTMEQKISAAALKEVDDYYGIIEGLTPEIIENLRIWGVKWYVFASNYDGEFYGLTPVFFNDYVSVWRDDAALPNFELANGTIKNYKITANSIDLQVDSVNSPTQATIRFAYHPNFTATVESVAPNGELVISKTTITQDENGAILLPNLSSGIASIHLEYRDPYFAQGIIIALILLFLCLLYRLARSLCQIPSRSLT